MANASERQTFRDFVGQVCQLDAGGCGGVKAKPVIFPPKQKPPFEAVFFGGHRNKTIKSIADSARI